MRIVVMGAGSMGSIIGALISKGGLDVVLADPFDEHVRAMNDRGLKITGQMDETIPVKAITPDKLDGIYDLAIYVPKATANETALNQLMPHLGPQSTVITLQNGVNEDIVAAAVGAERTCGGTMLWGATMLEPGVTNLTSERAQMSMVIGEVDGSITDRIRRVKEVLDKTGNIEITDQLMSHRWSKLYINAAFSGVGTVIGGDYGAVVDNEKAVRAAAWVGMETVKTAKALGHDKTKFLFVDPDSLIFENEEQLGKIIDFYRAALKGHRGTNPSMLQDVWKGRCCEVEVINGYMQKKAREAGVATPVNDQVTEIIREIDGGRRKPAPENMNDINLPDLK